MKVRIINRGGHPGETEVIAEDGQSLVRAGRVLFPIEIRVDEKGTFATLRVEVSELEIEAQAQIMLKERVR